MRECVAEWLAKLLRYVDGPAGMSPDRVESQSSLIQFRYGFHLTKSAGLTAELGRIRMRPAGPLLRRN